MRGTILWLGVWLLALGSLALLAIHYPGIWLMHPAQTSEGNRYLWADVGREQRFVLFLGAGICIAGVVLIAIGKHVRKRKEPAGNEFARAKRCTAPPTSRPKTDRVPELEDVGEK